MTTSQRLESHERPPRPPSISLAAADFARLSVNDSATHHNPAMASPSATSPLSPAPKSAPLTKTSSWNSERWGSAVQYESANSLDRGSRVGTARLETPQQNDSGVRRLSKQLSKQSLGVSTGSVDRASFAAPEAFNVSASVVDPPVPGDFSFSVETEPEVERVRSHASGHSNDSFAKEGESSHLHHNASGHSGPPSEHSFQAPRPLPNYPVGHGHPPYGMQYGYPPGPPGPPGPPAPSYAHPGPGYSPAMYGRPYVPPPQQHYMQHLGPPPGHYSYPRPVRPGMPPPSPYGRTPNGAPAHYMHNGYATMYNMPPGSGPLHPPPVTNGYPIKPRSDDGRGEQADSIRRAASPIPPPAAPHSAIPPHMHARQDTDNQSFHSNASINTALTTPSVHSAIGAQGESLEVFRQNAKKSNDPAVQLEFAKHLIATGEAISLEPGSDVKKNKRHQEALFQEALKLIKKLATTGGIGKAAYPDAQFFFAECYGNGSLHLPVDHDRAFALYVAASKQAHPAATYRTAVCYEVGAGTKRDSGRSMQFYRKAAALGDTAAMYKVGMIMMNGLLGQSRNPREGVTWLKRAAAQADENTPHALHELGVLYEGGTGESGVIPDPQHSHELFLRAAQLGYAASQFKLGFCYEYGLLSLPVDPRRSIAWYTRAAEQTDPDAELALSGWYLTGAEGVLRQSDTEAYLWARKAADKGLAKAEYAVGWYSENGVGVKADLEEARRWYLRAAAQGNKRAVARVKELKSVMYGTQRNPAGHLTPGGSAAHRPPVGGSMRGERPPPRQSGAGEERAGDWRKQGQNQGAKDSECVVM